MSDKFRFNPDSLFAGTFRPPTFEDSVFTIEFNTRTPREFAESIRQRISEYGSSISDELANYLEETIAVIEIGKYRSAVIQLFCMAIERLWIRLWDRADSDEKKWCEWIDSITSTTTQNQELKKYGFRQKDIKKPDRPFNQSDWHVYYMENELLVLGNLRGFYDTNALHSLYHDCFKLRCKAAHPSKLEVSPEQVAIMLRPCIKYLWVFQ